MEDDRSWLERRRMVRLDITIEFSRRTGISRSDFLRIFYDAMAPPSIGDFNSQYLPGEAVLDEIMKALAESTGLEPGKIRSLYKRKESFPQFGERLLRAGAYD